MKKPTLIILIISSILTLGIIIFGILVLLGAIEFLNINAGVYILGCGPTIIIWGPLLSWGILKARERKKQDLPIMKKPTRIVLIISVALFVVTCVFSGLVWVFISDGFAAGILSFSLMGVAGIVIIFPPLISYLIMRKKSLIDESSNINHFIPE